MKILLSVKEITLGYLTQIGDKYAFLADENNIEEAYKKYPLQMRFFELNQKGEGYYNRIPAPFNLNIEATQRRDLVEKAQIKEDDSLFVKLYKLAKLETLNEMFTISQA